MNIRPYFDFEPQGEKDYLIVIASNRGLCGNYNVNIKRHLPHDPHANFVVLGARLFNNINIRNSFLKEQIPPTPDKFFAFSNNVIKQLTELRSLRILYTHYSSPINQLVTTINVFEQFLKPTGFVVKETVAQDIIQDYAAHYLTYCLYHASLSKQNRHECFLWIARHKMLRKCWMS